MAKREVFVNPPLRVVSFEVRFPVTSRVLTRPVWDAFEAALGEELPYAEVLVEDAEASVPTDIYGPVLRRTSEGRKRAVTLHPGAVTVELADYKDFDDLVRIAAAALQGVEAVAETLRCTRIGLRYVNEVRSNDAGSTARWAEPSSWEPYISRELLRTIESPPEGLSVFACRGGLTLRATAETDLSYVFLDYGVHPTGIVYTEDVLSLSPVEGPCFVLDIDGQVPGSTTLPVATTTPDVLAELEKLHNAVESTFHWSITERCKEEVFRVPPSSVEANDASPAVSA